MAAMKDFIHMFYAPGIGACYLFCCVTVIVSTKKTKHLYNNTINYFANKKYHYIFRSGPEKQWNVFHC